MNSDKYPIRMKLTVTEVGIRHRVEGKAYERMDFKAVGDKAGGKVLDFVTFSPDVMDAVESGKPFDADVVVEGKECCVTKLVQPDREVAMKAQTAVKAIARMRAGGVKVAEKTIKKQEKLIEQWLDEALK